MKADEIIGFAHELQALSSAGLLYTKSEFDVERFRRIREIASELTAFAADEPIDKVRELFEENDGYQTPKLSTRAAIFNEKEELLLVREKDGKWVMPGGWCDYDQTVRSNTIKEALEEAGLKVEPYRLVGLFDHKTRNHPNSFFYCTHVFMLCRVMQGEFRRNIETIDSRYFAVNELPELNDHKTSREQIMLCLEAYRADVWEPVVD